MPTLVIANKVYSSWSLRPWLALRHAGIPFDEVLIPLDQPDTRARILAHSPAGRVPVLIDGEVTVWESLAILEYAAERWPEAGIWPGERAARAHARAISAEMHSGFQALCAALPMNLGRRYAARDRGPAVAADFARVTAIWRDARARFGAGGPFLFGAFSGADAMFAPVVTRLDTYAVAVDPEVRAYMEAVLGLPALAAWREAALREPWIVPADELDEAPAATLRPQP
ncbi:Glutathione S-transferase domain [Methylobacterium sp. 4-46]|uniref:glutathione S-transferase family protein n=1 Tax=unclassified Methylobacterium TaxID=2615210 RepID=UPI000165C902|nr:MULTISPECIES: glutathione S-transferase family protein [Methylobacterium]ACA17560.1 Glutathione S-transferase domain [Methylobacterium sp. 4-46]WFT83239.1 glutathione S-transferase family protein [Methylobacterium nodulans]